MKISRIIRIIITLTVILGAGFLVYWTSSYYYPMSEVNSIMYSDANINYSTYKFFTYTPTLSNIDIGVIIYPEERVNPKAYLPLAKSIAQNGYKTVIVKMPLNHPALGINKALEVLNTYPEIKNWAIIGHATGGEAAAQFAYAYPNKVNSLFLLSSLPPKEINLVNETFKIVVLYGSNDPFITSDGINQARNRLPFFTDFIEISGGNRSQFGWYGLQKGDKPANISRDEQQQYVIDAVMKYFHK